jgi:hypothetical protein
MKESHLLKGEYEGGSFAKRGNMKESPLLKGDKEKRKAFPSLEKRG